MQWSKLKKLIEGNFCPSLKGRVELRSTRYRGTHDQEGKGWITVDKKEIYNMCTMKWMIEYYGLADDIRAANKCSDFRDPDQAPCYYAAYDQAQAVLEKKGVYSQYAFYESLERYLSLSIDKALESQNTLIRALAMIDKRFGKRRLKNFVLPKHEHPLVQYMYRLRCKAEGLASNRKGV